MKIGKQTNVHPDIARIYELIIEGIKHINDPNRSNGQHVKKDEDKKVKEYGEKVTTEDEPSGFVNCTPQEWSAYNVLAPPDVVKTLTDLKNFPNEKLPKLV